MIADRSSLLLFIKYPREGQVKTRLAAEIGSSSAVWFYRRFVELFLQRFRSMSQVDCTIYFDPIEEEEPIRKWLGTQWDYLPQPAGDLGDRLCWGFENRFLYYSSVIAVGSDSPDLPLDYLNQAIDVLQHKELVIGPAYDGGYYLIGLSKPAPQLFKGIAWSTSIVFEQTLAKAISMNLTYSILPSWYDVDTRDDLNRLHQSECPGVQAIFQNHASMGRPYENVELESGRCEKT